MRWMWIGLIAVGGCGGGGEDKQPTSAGDDDDDSPGLIDADGDGVSSDSDCDDQDATVFPGASEVPYDGIDQDCAAGDLVDVDADGFDAQQVGGADCDDGDGGVNPDASDSVGDGIDNNCDRIDGVDDDADGYASEYSGGDDCDDFDDEVSPGATEIWYDNFDQDCARDCDHDQDADGAIEVTFVVNDNSACDADPTVGTIDAPGDCDDTNALATFQAIVGNGPLNGASHDEPVYAELSAPDPAATLTVTDPAGVAVAGTLTIDDVTLTFVPSAPLRAETQFEVVVEHACASESWSFVTRGEPGALDPSLIARVWEADLATATWVEPVGIGALLGAFIERRWWITPVELTPGTGELLLAPVAGGVQELCVPTTRVYTDQLLAGAPTVAGPLDFTSDLDGIPVEARDIVMTGSVAANGSSLDSVRLSYWVDTVPLVDFVAPGGADNEVCGLVAAFGVSCTPCPDGSSNFCLDAVVDLGAVPEVSATPIERTEATIAADLACP